ncbi:winged helix-turn-helix domain-containing protein [Aurantiacibacter marinus]|uniref:OmpR/PhoB-type domain-containing protein n=1 Tax=Aurantiacibacter marinus TaxID=874156 RepID=A0A0H0XNH7_9SPHN|nr:winged helix-turn-helix domain-containing protein [Aurantiacibacter marinus]KLI63581.1 hypothetical protein AAV99_07420 [Aurantiacibacter marinus]
MGEVRPVPGQENGAPDPALSPIDLAREQPFELGSLRVVPYKTVVEGAGGEEHVEPKVMQVLVTLARTPGRIFSRDDLIECCWDGRIVGDASVTRVISRLRAVFRNLGEDDAQIETLPKVGYRLLMDGDEAVSTQPLQSPQAEAKRRFPILAIAIIAIAMLASAFAWFTSRPITDPLTVVMLPLEASEGVDPFYASGMEAEIRSQLGRNTGMEVRAGESAIQLAAEGRSPAEIGTALDADLVWQGELSNSVATITLNARLIDPETGENVWTDSLQSAPDAAEFLPLRAVRVMLEALGRPPQSEDTQQAGSDEDYALYLTAMGLLKGRGVEQRMAAYEILEQVVDRNRNFADGLAGLAKANFLYPTTDRAEKDARSATALEQAEAALELDPRSVDALKVAGILQIDDLELQLQRLRLATQIDPGDAEAWFWRGIVERDAGPGDGKVLETVRHLVAVDPLWPASWRASDSAMELGDFDLARELERRVIAASATEPQRLLARARLARIDGDLSEFMRLVREARGNLSDAERRWGFFTQERYARFLLGLQPMDSGVVVPVDARTDLLDQMRDRTMPTRNELLAAGITPQNFWDDRQIAGESMSLLLRDGREDELLAYYDAKFDAAPAFVNWAQDTDRAHQILPFASPYLALAMRRAGRDREAQEMVALAREWTQLWSDSGQTSVFSLLYELRLAALTGDDASAIAVIQRLPDYGWPLQLSHVNYEAIGLLADDPLYEEVRELPQVRAVLGSIRAHFARERREVLALGFE